MANALGATTFLAQIAIFAATIALLVSFLIAQQAARFGPAVAQRFLERGDVIPPGNAALNAANLAVWVHDPDNATSVKGYARTVISIDIVFLLAFGTFLATAARFVAERVDWRILDAASLWWWVLAILPGLYVIADFLEDILIVHLLENPDAIPGRFDLLRKVTSWKMRTSIGAFAQLAILFAVLLALGSSPPLSTP